MPIAETTAGEVAAGVILFALAFIGVVVAIVVYLRQLYRNNVENPRDELIPNVTNNINKSRKGLVELFELGKVLASIFAALNALGIVVLVIYGLNTNNWLMVMYGFLVGASAILFCILAIAVFSIQEEVSGMRHAQLKANDIDEESMKLLRFMAKRLADKQGK